MDELCIATMDSTRNTIIVEDAELVTRSAFEGEQYVLRFSAPRIAGCAKPGHFIHLQCDPRLPMRRPMSIMRASPEQGWIEILFKNHGIGTQLLSQHRAGDSINVIGPIGVPFNCEQVRRRPLLIGGGVGIPPMVFLAEQLRAQSISSFVIMGSEIPFPFPVKPSQIMVPGVPAEAIGCMPLLEDWGIASRLASRAGIAGCFDGLVTDLAKSWIDYRIDDAIEDIEIFACGPTPMLKAVAALAADYGIACQISLEEYMACAVGGCAGCAVRVRTPNGYAMKRVCVDGPVFEASDVVFA